MQFYLTRDELDLVVEAVDVIRESLEVLPEMEGLKRDAAARLGAMADEARPGAAAVGAVEMDVEGDELAVLRVALRWCMDNADDDLRECGGESAADTDNDARLFLERRNMAQRVALRVD